MPPKKVTVKTGASSTPNIMVMLSKPKTNPKTFDVATAVANTKSDVIESNTYKSAFDLSHEDPVIQEYYNSLTPNEKIAHTIAKEKLGTSYDVSRTHGFLRWQKARK
jgi:hypothetical protein